VTPSDDIIKDWIENASSEKERSRLQKLYSLINFLRRDNARMQKSLQFYADKGTWEPVPMPIDENEDYITLLSGPSEALIDHGEIARLGLMIQCDE